MSSRAVIAVLTALAIAGVGSVAPAGGANRFRACKQVNFTPQSDDLAAHIKVRNVSCRYARRFIRETDGAPPARHRRWSCSGRMTDDGGLPHTNYRCERGDQVMRWARY